MSEKISQKIAKKTSKKISIIGAGAWGTALAIHLARNAKNQKIDQILLTSNNSQQIDQINQTGYNSKIFPEIKLPEIITADSDFNEDSDFLFLVVPSQNLDEVLVKIASKKIADSCILVLCTKGISADGKSLISDKIRFSYKKNSKNLVVLSGPNFASEVAKGLPATTSIASANQLAAQKVIELLSAENFAAIYLTDIRTAEICGSFKNVMAIGCGLIDGLDLGENCKAALILRGIAESKSLCNVLGASDDLANPAGFGDIFLTCSSVKSRNFSLGLELAKNSINSISSFKSEKTCEGAIASGLLLKLAEFHQISLPFCEMIWQILQKIPPKEELKKRLIKAILH